MTCEEFGNYHYGYVGKAAEILDFILIFGSGIAQGEALNYNEITDRIWIRMVFDSYNEDPS